jgi:NodT family efflux transporter outer membrane factor (OMF) lipoprotein
MLRHRAAIQLHFGAAISLVGVLAFAVPAYSQVACGGLNSWWQNGCKVGPNYMRPAAPVAGKWIDDGHSQVKTGAEPPCYWWKVFNDPTLDYLTQTAYQQNLTLRTAGARILEARAQLGIARGEMFPQEQSTFAQYSRNKVSSKIANAPPEQWFSQWDVGLTASWELDFWGRFRRAIEAAEAELDASVEDHDDVLVILLSDVATNYVQYRTFEQRIAYARTNAEIQRKSFGIASDRFEHGATTERDTQQAKQSLEQTEALIPVLEIGKRQAANRLCVLLGMPPTNLDQLLAVGAGIPVTPPEVIVGVPCDLLRRRPDVRRAERQVAAQSARIGIAISDLYPHFSLLGTIGLSAEHFGDLFDTPGSMVGNISPGVRWDILNYGRLINNVRVQDARFQALAYSYQDRVLNAGREVEDAMVVFLRSQEEAKHLDASVAAAARTVEITEEQYTQGAVDFTAVYLFQTTLTEQQDQLAAARGNIALGLIGVYRSLGGGWEIRLPCCNPGAMVFGPPPLDPTPTLPEPAPKTNEDARAAFYRANGTTLH